LAAGIAAVIFLQASREVADQSPALDGLQEDAAVQRSRLETASLERDGTSDAGAATAPKGDPLANLTDLAGLSETFRNTTFLIAIRDAGFACDDVVAAYQSGAGLWMASCRDLSGYEIHAAEAEDLVVRPAASYFDSLDRSREILNDRFRIDRDAPLELPRQRRRVE
jgi:hypothetical protein